MKKLWLSIVNLYKSFRDWLLLENEPTKPQKKAPTKPNAISSKDLNIRLMSLSKELKDNTSKAKKKSDDKNQLFSTIKTAPLVKKPKTKKDLELELDEAIEKENYEKAAKLRDKIKTIKA